MKFEPRTLTLKDGRTCILRPTHPDDAADMIEYLKITAAETPFLLRYPDEVNYTLEGEKEILGNLLENEYGVMMLAEVDGRVAGNCSLNGMGNKRRVLHRSSLAIALKKEFWNLGIGTAMMQYLEELARQIGYEQYYSIVPSHIKMSFFPSRSNEFKEYWSEMQYCIEFAKCNRALMMSRIMEIISDVHVKSEFEPMIDIAHNYASIEKHFGQKVIVHRKGAIRVPKESIGIIPGSQGTCSYIVEGLGNQNSFCSALHGAGRAISRLDAKRKLDLKHEIGLMNKRGIIHNMRSINDLDEATGAYKDIDAVMDNQKDLVNIVTKLFPLAVIKG